MKKGSEIQLKITDMEFPSIGIGEIEGQKFNIKNAVVCGVSSADGELCRIMTVKKAASYIQTIIEK